MRSIFSKPTSFQDLKIWILAYIIYGALQALRVFDSIRPGRWLGMLLLIAALPGCAHDEAFRNSMAILAAGLSGAGGAQTETASLEGCNSDFDCSARRYGDVCVKRDYAFAGTCLTPVASNGMPLPARMPQNNVGAMGRAANGCRFDYQCPVMFRCEVATGACVR